MNIWTMLKLLKYAKKHKGEGKKRSRIIKTVVILAILLVVIIVGIVIYSSFIDYQNRQKAIGALLSSGVFGDDEGVSNENEGVSNVYVDPNTGIMVNYQEVVPSTSGSTDSAYYCQEIIRVMECVSDNLNIPAMPMYMCILGMESNGYNASNIMHTETNKCSIWEDSAKKKWARDCTGGRVKKYSQPSASEELKLKAWQAQSDSNGHFWCNAGAVGMFQIEGNFISKHYFKDGVAGLAKGNKYVQYIFDHKTEVSSMLSSMGHSEPWTEFNPLNTEGTATTTKYTNYEDLMMDTGYCVGQVFICGFDARYQTYNGISCKDMDEFGRKFFAQNVLGTGDDWTALGSVGQGFAFAIICGTDWNGGGGRPNHFNSTAVNTNIKFEPLLQEFIVRLCKYVSDYGGVEELTAQLESRGIKVSSLTSNYNNTASGNMTTAICEIIGFGSDKTQRLLRDTYLRCYADVTLQNSNGIYYGIKGAIRAQSNYNTMMKAMGVPESEWQCIYDWKNYNNVVFK